MTEDKEQLRTQLCDALMYLCVPEEYQEKIDNLKESEKPYHKNYHTKKTSYLKGLLGGTFGIGAGTFLTIAASVFLVGAIIGVAVSGDLLGIVVGLIPCIYSMPIACMLAPIPSIIYFIIVNKKQSGKADQYWKSVAAPAIQKIRQQIREIEDERDRFLNEYAYVLDFLPEDYREVMAVGYMEECIRNLRADTLKEAINLYEEQKHRWTMESLAQQMLAETEMHNQIMRTGLQAIYDEQRRTTAMATNIRNLTLFNTMRDIHKEIKSS